MARPFYASSMIPGEDQYVGLVASEMTRTIHACSRWLVRCLVAVLALVVTSCAAPQAIDQPDRLLFSFVQLTDTHCVTTTQKPTAPPLQTLLRVGGYKFHWKDLPNAFARLQGTVSYLNTVVRPQLVIHTGDITDKGDLMDLLRAKKLLDALKASHYALMGDNDLGMPVRRFKSNRDASDFVKVFGKRNTAFEFGGWRFILLSAYPGEEDIAWLKQELDASGNKPAVLCSHRPIMVDALTETLAKSYYTGVQLTVSRAPEVESLLRQHPNVRLVLAGHCHCNLGWQRDGIQFFTAAALVGAPATFRLFRVYQDRLEVTVYWANNMAEVRAGRWQAEPPQVVWFAGNYPGKTNPQRRN